MQSVVSAILVLDVKMHFLPSELSLSGGHSRASRPVFPLFLRRRSQLDRQIRKHSQPKSLLHRRSTRQTRRMRLAALPFVEILLVVSGKHSTDKSTSHLKLFSAVHDATLISSLHSQSSSSSSHVSSHQLQYACPRGLRLHSDARPSWRRRLRQTSFRSISSSERDSTSIRRFSLLSRRSRRGLPALGSHCPFVNMLRRSKHTLRD